MIATRVLSNGQDSVRLEIAEVAEDPSAFCYRVVDSAGVVLESTVVYGHDGIQALLFCITAAGDYFRQFQPGFAFEDLGTTGLLETDLPATGVWRATVEIPTEAREA